jgi:hypothetical protein
MNAFIRQGGDVDWFFLVEIKAPIAAPIIFSLGLSQSILQ